MNLGLAARVCRELEAVGVQEVCLCAGARNSPFVALLSEHPRIRKFHFFEERSAAFFALGRIKSRGKPVAVVTTSGTAVAELLPATMEAHYTASALVLLTADRPRRYRGTGAPQSVEQAGIFGPYARARFDLEGAEPFSLEEWDRSGPLHLNVCFDEPLLDRSLRTEDFAPPRTFPQAVDKDGDNPSALEAFLERSRLPLVIVSGLEERHRPRVEEFLLRLGAPVFLEGTSGLRDSPALRPLSLESTDRLLARLGSMRNPVDGVLRIGGVPTLRFWRDLESKRSDLPVLSISDSPFAGSTRSELLHVPDGGKHSCLGEMLSCAQVRNRVDPGDFADLIAEDRRLAGAIAALLEREPFSEPALVHALSRRIPAGARVYLGNSMPIREWDLAATREAKRFAMSANRGANGIDGQVSSFLGFAEPRAENWAVIGDLTALYDLSAPWILSQLPETGMRLVVIHNGGGKIFERLFASPTFQNRHDTSFEPWAALWGLRYERWDRVAPDTGSADALADPASRVLIELRPDEAATARFWDGYDRLCRV